MTSISQEEAIEKQMKVALAVNRVLPDMGSNLAMIVSMANEAADNHVELVVFPEAAVTGLVNNGDFSHDVALAQAIPGPVTRTLSELSQKKGICLAIGLLEEEEGRLYDSAVLFTRDSGIALKYRRIGPHWHYENIDSSIYCEGKELSRVKTPFATFIFLICGDLYNDQVVKSARNLRADWLLYLQAYGPEDGSYDQREWDKEDKPRIIKQVRLIGTTTLMTNYLADMDMEGGCGGAVIVKSDGTVLASFPLGKVGILYANL